MARITTPVPGYSGQGPGNLHFNNGVAETDNEAIIAYCRSAGYGIDGEPPEREAPQVPDPREVTTVVVGAPARDAAVDPKPGDFRPPVNAGEANPHGPEVYAPGLPGGGLQPTAPPADPDEVTSGEHEAGPDTPPPAQSAPVAEWRQWVITSVVDNDPEVHAEVEKMTKAELIKKYGG
ncbi:hypothetical protein PV620_30240 [Streptomyces sp. ME02-6978a]|uniref:hypothetical protein n=1 Tax=unclassified Streptomyces TaxID=2593676 RepID=UPI0029BBC4A9|nr:MULTISPECIES: hypothetical protein [unclassified Streptomyces]MDX3087186.1 hypothetical protein [Streptomyces sp. ME12-02E]MDX3335828.1 hypothetical protein [Streptomyces sp. ME02-6978a]